MRILIIGFIVFLIWSIFSVWLYVEKLKPAKNDIISVQSTPEIQTALADSVIQPELLIPNAFTIYFDFNATKFNFNSQIENNLIEFKEWLAKKPESSVSITGYTDNIGTSEYNLKLGLERGLAVQNYFLIKGVDITKIIVDSKGESYSISDQTTAEGRAKNRRAVITIKN